MVGAIKRLIRWCVIGIAGDDLGLRPVQQTQYLGKTGDAAVVFPYGYHANVPPGYPALMLSLMGKGENRAILPMSWTKRPKPSPVGDVVMYSPEYPTTEFRLQAGGDAELNAPGKDLHVTTDTYTLSSTGNATVRGIQLQLFSTLGSVVISSTLGAGDINLFGAVKVSGDIEYTGTLKKTGTTVDLTTHVHDENDSGGPTDGPRSP